MRGTVCVGDGWVVETGASVPRFGVALICLSVCLSLERWGDERRMDMTCHNNMHNYIYTI